MDPQEELNQLLTRQETLRQDLKARKKELQDAQRRQRNNLQKQIRRAQARLSAAERKRDTRWKILIGGTVLARAAHDPNAADRLDRMMDEALTEVRDRELLERWRGLRVATATGENFT